MENSISSSIPTETKPYSNKGPLIFISGLITLLVISLVIFVYQLTVNPTIVLGEAFQKTAQVRSMHIQASDPDTTVTFTADINRGKNQLSKTQIAIHGIEGNRSSTFTTSLIFNNKDIYLSTDFSKIEEMENRLQTLYPQITVMQTYKLLLPVISGDKWLHAEIPQDWMKRDKTNTTNKTNTTSKSLSEKDQKALEKLVKEAIVLRKHDSRYAFEGSQYDRYLFGLKKDKLVAMLNKLKDTDLDIKVSQINAMLKVVNSVDNWNDDLVEILIDAHGRVALVSLSLPAIPEGALKESLEEGAKDSQFAAMAQNSVETVANFFKPKESKGLKKIGTIRISKYNETLTVEVPTNLVEMQEVLEVGKKEILPLLGAMFGSSLTMPGGRVIPLPSPAPVQRYQAPRQVNYVQPPQYSYPTPKPGEMGSQEWLDNFNKEWEAGRQRTEELSKQMDKDTEQFWKDYNANKEWMNQH